MPAAQRPLWACPSCGHKFVTPNTWHSCSRHTLDDHFRGKAPAVRHLFDRWLAFVQQHGGLVTVISQKTRIVFMVRVRFGGATIQKKAVRGALWLKRKVVSDCFYRVEQYTSRDYGYFVRLTDPAQLNAELAGYVREAYAIGCQRTPADA